MVSSGLYSNYAGLSDFDKFPAGKWSKNGVVSLRELISAILLNRGFNLSDYALTLSAAIDVVAPRQPLQDCASNHADSSCTFAGGLIAHNCRFCVNPQFPAGKWSKNGVANLRR